MRQQRKRKALYVDRREELYPEALLQKEYAAEVKLPAAKSRPKPRARPGVPRTR